MVGRYAHLGDGAVSEKMVRTGPRCERGPLGPKGAPGPQRPAGGRTREHPGDDFSKRTLSELRATSHVYWRASERHGYVGNHRPPFFCQRGKQVKYEMIFASFIGRTFAVRAWRSVILLVIKFANVCDHRSRKRSSNLPQRAGTGRLLLHSPQVVSHAFPG